jgi:hypothetical protein
LETIVATPQGVRTQHNHGHDVHALPVANHKVSGTNETPKDRGDDERPETGKLRVLYTSLRYNDIGDMQKER